MSMRILILPFSGSDESVQARDDAQGNIEVQVMHGLNSLTARLDRGQQHMLFLFLEERLRR